MLGQWKSLYRESYEQRLPQRPTNVQWCAKCSIVGHKFSATNFCIDLSSRASVTSSAFLSKVKWRFGVPTNCFIWSQWASYLCASRNSDIASSITLSAFAVIIECGWKGVDTMSRCSNLQNVWILSLRACCWTGFTGIISTIYSSFASLVDSRNNASAACCITPAIWMTSISNSISRRYHGTSFPVASARMRIHLNG